MANKTWPLTRLANNRTPKLNALAIYEINSINTKKNTITVGVPAGTKKEKKCNLCVYRLRIVVPIHTVKLKPIANTMEVEIANEYGKFPIKLLNKINTNKE